MTELYINGQLAVLSEDFYFTLASENPYYTQFQLFIGYRTSNVGQLRDFWSY